MKNLKDLFIVIAICLIQSNSFATALSVQHTLFNSTSTEFDFRKPAFENVSICRLQVEVTTSNFKGAETDSPVFIKVNGRDAPYYLNLSHNDREKGKRDVYDVISPNVNKIKDVQFIHLELIGNDGWNVSKIRLLINNKEVYARSYGSTGYWLDGNHKSRSNKLVISRSTLRKHANFRYNRVTFGIENGPAGIPKAMIDDLVESAVGNALKNVKEISWGQKQGKYFISSKRINDNTLRYDLDLSYEINNAPNVEIDVDFDLVFECDNGVVKTTVKNYKSKAYGAMAFLMSKKAYLDKVLYKKCLSLGDPTSIAVCSAGVWMVGQMLDFNFNYEDESAGNIGLGKDCTGQLKLDTQGNLLLGQKKSTRNSKRPRAAAARVKRF